MRLQNIIITEKLAKQIDDLLKMAVPKKMRVIAPVTNDEELNVYKAIGEILEEMGYAQRVNGNLFDITPSGLFFVNNGGFTALYNQKKEENEKSDEIARLTKELTIRQITASKREKWLILWGIVSTLAAITLSYLELTNTRF